MGRGSWIILRTAGRSTLPLAASLARDGIEAWTPSEANRERGRRGKARKPILPTYVFARAQHLWRLVSLAEDPLSRHDSFSVFRYMERFPIVPDDQLEPLRSEEYQKAPEEEQPVYDKGECVRVADPAFGGMLGKVDKPGRKYTLVLFPLSPIPMKISTFLLRADEAYQLQSETDTAARAA